VGGRLAVRSNAVGQQILLLLSTKKESKQTASSFSYNLPLNTVLTAQPAEEDDDPGGALNAELRVEILGLQDVEDHQVVGVAEEVTTFDLLQKLDFDPDDHYGPALGTVYLRSRLDTLIRADSSISGSCGAAGNAASASVNWI
jgi:hypothetical protein